MPSQAQPAANTWITLITGPASLQPNISGDPGGCWVSLLQICNTANASDAAFVSHVPVSGSPGGESSLLSALSVAANGQFSLGGFWLAPGETLQVKSTNGNLVFNGYSNYGALPPNSGNGFGPMPTQAL